MSGNKLLNQKGYLLMESIFSWLLILSCVSLYIPMMSRMLIIVNSEKEAVNCYRILYEQTIVLETEGKTDVVWETNGKEYRIAETIELNREGICVYGKEKKAQIQLKSFESI